MRHKRVSNVFLAYSSGCVSCAAGGGFSYVGKRFRRWRRSGCSTDAHRDGWRPRQLFPIVCTRCSACGRHRGRLCRRGGTWASSWGEPRGGYATQEGASQGATETVDSVRLAAARTIVPGCGLALVGWKPAMHTCLFPAQGSSHRQPKASTAASVISAMSP